MRDGDLACPCHVLQTVGSDESVFTPCHSVEHVVQLPASLNAPPPYASQPLKASGGDGEGETFRGLVGTRRRAWGIQQLRDVDKSSQSHPKSKKRT